MLRRHPLFEPGWEMPYGRLQRYENHDYLFFTYYFNPTPNDQNLEWDTKRDLFGNLGWEKTPNLP